MNKLSIIFVTFFLILNPAHAEVASRSGSNDQAQALIQQLGSERTRLTAENAKLKKQLKEAESKLESLEKDNETTSDKLNSVQSQLSSKTNLSEELTQRLSQAKTRMEEMISKYRETALTLRDKETESAQRAQEITRLDRELKSCATNNVALSKLGYEVLDNYENKGFWARAGQKEPFTQLKKVQIENLVDEYTYLIQDQEYKIPVNSE